MCIAQNLQASCPCRYSIDDGSDVSRSGTAHENAERTANPSQEREKSLSVAMFRSRSQSLESREGSALPESEGLLPKVDVPCSHIYNCALYNFCCLSYQLSIYLSIAWTNVPLREGLVAPDMPSFTGSTSFSRLRVTLASRTRAVGSHSDLAQVLGEYCLASWRCNFPDK